MINGISSNTASSVSGNTQIGQTQRQATTASQNTTKTAGPEADSVELSATAQARLMMHQGMSVKQIAANLGLSVQAVSASLGLTTTSTPVAAAQPSTGKK